MTLSLLLATMLAAIAPGASDSPLPLAELPTQKLAANECALVLWDRTSGRRVAMLTLRPEAIRVVSGGVLTNLPRTAAEGTAVAGFVPQARFGNATLQISVALKILANDSAGSAIVRDGVIAVTGSDGVEIVAPVAGIAGCGG